MVRTVLLALVAAGFAPVVAAPPKPAAVSRIVFGSCADQNKPCPIWEKVADAKPDLLVLLGDNIYADIENGKLKPSTPDKMADCYKVLAADAGFKRVRETAYLMATWDDHDYGNNDAGEEWLHKDDAQKQFLDFLGTPAESPRRKQKGVYWAETFGPEGKRVQVIMLDGRYFRSPIRKADKPLPGTTIRPYLPNTDADATMLGEEQWKWLEEQLKQPAEVRLIGSGIQVVSEDHPFEKWACLPNERARLYKVIRESGAGGVIVLSGDRHLADISCDPKAVGYPLYDATSSGFNQGSLNYRNPEENKYRVGGMPWGNNFGVIQIDWAASSPLVTLQLRGEDGEVAAQARVPLSRLQKGEVKPAAKPADPVKLPEGVLAPAEALKKAKGDEVTVQFEVAGGNTVSGGKRILLNSLKDFKSDDNFTVVVNEKAMTGKYEKATFDTFKGKTIRAKGKLSEFQKKLQIQIDDAAMLEIVEAKEEKKDN
jgi:alkaline phosphatase D